MHALTEDVARACFVNATDEEMRMLSVSTDFILSDWDHTDFCAWRDPALRGRGYLIVEVDARPVGVIMRAAEGSSRARSALCNICHTMQPADQVTLFTARKAGSAGRSGDSVGTYLCADLSCHETVRLAAPLAPSEMRASVDRKIDGTRHRAEAFVAGVMNGVRSTA